MTRLAQALIWWPLFTVAFVPVPVHASEQGTASAAGTEVASSQESGTRAEEWLARRRARLATLEPAKRSAVVDFLTTAENDGFDQLVTFQIRHFRVGFGKISPVSGPTPGIQYERPRLGRSPITLRTSGAYSFRGYQAYDLQLGVFDTPAPYEFLGDGFLGAPFEFDNRSQAPLGDFLYLDAHARRFPGETFYGVGPDSSKDDRTEYRINESAIDVVAGYQPVRWLGVEARGSFLTVDTGAADSDRLESVGDVFPAGGAPGFGERTSFLHLDAGLFAGWIGDPNLPGAQLGLRYSRFDDTDTDRHQFQRVSFDARGFMPLGSRQRTLAARVYASSDVVDEGGSVPFYLMKTLGGHDTLRGYQNFRFRDTNLLYLSTEYRWEAAAGIELALFYDLGKVFSDRAEFDFSDMKDSWGAGIRGRSMRRVVFRLDIGTSREGTFAYVAFGPSF